MNLLQFYESILLTAGFSIGSDGAISLALEEPVVPMTIGQRRLVLPTPQQLKGGDWTKRIGFHPLAENILKGESEVFSRYRATLNRRLNQIAAGLILELLYIAASPAEQRNLNGAQSEYLVKVKDADERTYESIRKLLAKLPIDDPASNLISLTMKRNGTIGKERYPRVCVVGFPVYEAAVASKDHSVMGVKLRVKDIEVLKAILEYIFPNLQAPEAHYSKGSDSKIAPYTVALLESTYSLIERTNEITTLFWGNNSEKYNVYALRDDWFNLIKDLNPLVKEIRLIPNLESTAPNVPEPPVQAVTPPTPPQPKPVQATTQYPTLDTTNTPVAPQPVQQAVAQPASPHVAPPVLPTQQPTQAAPVGYTWQWNGVQWVAVPVQQAVAPVQAVPTTPPQQLAPNSLQAIIGTAPTPPVAYPTYQQPVYQQPVYQQPVVGPNGWPMHVLQPGYTSVPQQVPQVQPGVMYQQPMYPTGSFGYPIKG